MHRMSSETPNPDSISTVPGPPEPAAPAATAGPGPEPSADVSRTSPEEEWIEEYEEEQVPARPKKKRHWGSIVAVTVVIVFMVVWTVLSPSVLSQAGTTYVDSDSYADMGNYTGERDIWWLGKSIHVVRTVWGVSISGDRNATVGEPAEYSVLITKVEEALGSFWFRGTSVNLKEVTMYDSDGNLLGEMYGKTQLDFGPLGHVTATFDQPGQYECHLVVKLRVYAEMRIGFIPLEDVEIEAHFSEYVVVSAV